MMPLFAAHMSQDTNDLQKQAFALLVPAELLSTCENMRFHMSCM